MVEGPPCTAGDVAPTPGQRNKTPHAAEQLGWCALTTEHVRCGAHVPQESLCATAKGSHMMQRRF